MTNESLFLACRRFFPIGKKATVSVGNEQDIIEYIEKRITQLPGKCGLMLSGGMDSAIMAKFMPENSMAYTVHYFRYPNEVKEARIYAKKNNLIHKKVMIKKRSFFEAVDSLIMQKQMPVLPHEATLYLACLQAKRDGCKNIITGINAGRLGGMQLLYKASEYNRFKQKLYNKYIDPAEVLIESTPIDWMLKNYRYGKKIDVQKYMNEVGTEGDAVETLIEVSGLNPVQPFSEIEYCHNFDIDRIIAGDGKYLIKNVYRILYGGHEPNKKIPLKVPAKKWLKNYKPMRPEFRKDIDTSTWGGKKIFLLYSLERYFALREKFGWPIQKTISIY